MLPGVINSYHYRGRRPVLGRPARIEETPGRAPAGSEPAGGFPPPTRPGRGDRLDRGVNNGAFARFCAAGGLSLDSGGYGHGGGGGVSAKGVGCGPAPLGSVVDPRPAFRSLFWERRPTAAAASARGGWGGAGQRARRGLYLAGPVCPSVAAPHEAGAGAVAAGSRRRYLRLRLPAGRFQCLLKVVSLRRGGKRVEGGDLPGRARARRSVRVLCPAPALYPVPNRSLDPATAQNVPTAQEFWGQCLFFAGIFCARRKSLFVDIARLPRSGQGGYAEWAPADPREPSPRPPFPLPPLPSSPLRERGSEGRHQKWPGKPQHSVPWVALVPTPPSPPHRWRPGTALARRAAARLGDGVAPWPPPQAAGCFLFFSCKP